MPLIHNPSMMRSPLGMHNPMPKMNVQGALNGPKAPMGPKFADGGMTNAMNDPWFERKDAQQALQSYRPGGLYGGATGGRTDNIANIVPVGAYVMPADVVSGLGEGNTQAGAAIMDKMFHSLPHGVQSDRMTHGRGAGMPAPPKPFNEDTMYAKGGMTKNHVPIITASGEFLVQPEAIVAKFGNLKRGHQILDNFVKHYRKKIAKKMLSLPGPKA